MRKRFVTSLVMVFLAAGLAFSQTPKAGIKIVGMTPYTLTRQYGSVGSGMYATTGLSTVGEKTIVYLQAIDSTGGTIQSVTWSVLDPTGGHAQIDSASAPFTTITVDTTGQYTINLQVTTAGGTSNTSTIITSANYVGVGSIGVSASGSVNLDSTTVFSNPFPQCVQCHQGTGDMTVWSNTPHASFFETSINGHNPAGVYFSSCIKCHTTGYNPNAQNGNFANVAAQTGWTFPSAPLVDTNFAHLYNTSKKLAQLGTIGCESCHGPGDQHMGDITKISVSMSASVCMQCHDAPPHHVNGRQWVNSPHDSAYAALQKSESLVNSGSYGCAKCHNGTGFKDFVNGALQEINYAPMKLTCAACHDPMDASLPHQLRTISADTLANGLTIANYIADPSTNVGQLCMNCHKARRNANATVAAGWKPYFGPHEGPQTDMFLGENGYQFGDSSIAGLNTHTQLSDACVTCHMSTDTVDAKATNLLGGHTWLMSGNDSAGVATDNTTACQSCHGPITDFDQIPAPYDYAGIANGGPMPGVQSEVQALLTKLASFFPDSVIANPSSPTVGKSLSKAQLGALYDYLFVSKDRSMGIHNAKYTFALLTRAISTLTGVKIISDKVPHTYALEQNYPNPFNPTTTINFSVPKTGIVNVSVYNSIGQLVKVLTNDNYVPGTYQVTWNATNETGSAVASGVYFYRFATKDFVRTMKMVLLK